jgi:GntR family transcriptional regulator of arabinose operon
LKPYYLQIKNTLVERIETGKLFKGQRIETEDELAARFKVSRPTIRQALSLLQDEGYIVRIQGRGTFVTDWEKRNRADTTMSTIGFVAPRLADIFIGRIIAGAQEVLSGVGYHVSVFATGDEMAKEREIIENLLEVGVAGMLIHPTKSLHYNSVMYTLVDRNVPFVMTGRHYRYLDCSYVEADNFQGAYDAVTYLIELGHERIGLVSKPPLIKTSLEDRIRGYLAALADHGIPAFRHMVLDDLCDTRSVYWDERSDEQVRNVFEQMKRFLDRAPEMTAVLALNDLIAADLMMVIKESGRVVGQDISVIGFDNVSISERIDPPLTTVDSPIGEIGHAAAELLLKQIEEPESPPKHMQLPTRLIKRDSCKR